jgi:hypothetical protein
MYIIDKTYFNGIINVPNVNEPTSDEADLLNTNIDKYARLFLQEVLGFEKFEELDSYIIEGQLDPTAPQMWLDLVNGATYTKDGKNYKWKGLKYDLGTSKISILAYFVYFNQYQNSFNSQIGQVYVEPKNGINANPTEHLTQIFNEFVEMYQGNCNARHKGVYQVNDVLFVDYFGNHSNSGYVALTEFLLHNKEVYEVDPPFFEFQNTFLS